jgi:hypothetical protein
VFVDKIQRGFVGAYANCFGNFGETTTKVDRFILREDEI